MANKIAKLIGKSEAELAEAIARLEAASGYRSEDVRFLAEANNHLRAKISQLSLDPSDTTAEELYHALRARFESDAKRIDKALGVSAQTDLDERITKAGKLVAHSLEGQRLWSLKNSIAKNLIIKNPPKKLMKALNYRSVGSLVKREDIAAIYIAADRLESASWHKKLSAQAAKFGSTSYELHPARVVLLSNRLAGLCQEKAVGNNLVGAVAVWPGVLQVSTPVLSISLVVLDELEKISETKITHKLHAVHPALAWWQDVEHLLHLHGEQVVSFNFKDVAFNHLAGVDFGKHSCEGAQQTFWSQLFDRYKQYFDELPQELASVESKAVESLLPTEALIEQEVEAL